MTTATLTADQVKFTTHLLHQLAPLPIKYRPTYEPSLMAVSTLPSPSRPFLVSSVPSSSILIQVKQLKPAHTYTVEMDRLDTIEMVKVKVSSLMTTAVPIESMRIVSGGKGLLDEKTLLDYEIKSGATLHLLQKPVGVVKKSGTESAIIPTVAPTTPTAAPAAPTIAPTVIPTTATPTVTPVAPVSFANALQSKCNDAAFWSKMTQLLKNEIPCAQSADVENMRKAIEIALRVVSKE